MGRKGAAVMGALLVGFLLGLIGFASASPHTGGGHRFNAIEPYDQGFDTYTDLGDPGLSQGDLDTFHFEVFDLTGKIHLGYETSKCVVGSVNGGIFTFDCSSDFVLTTGQIETEGTLELPVGKGTRGLALSGVLGDLPYHFAVTGGTETYRNSRGQLDWGNGEDAFILSFDLIG